MGTRHPETRPRARAAMTLIEMTIGMVITTMVVGAVGGVWYAVAENWTSSSSTQNVSTTGSQAAVRLEGLVREARYVCQWSPGSLDAVATPAAALVWRADAWATNADGTDPDGAVQVAELVYVQHDPAAQRIYYWEAIPKSAMTADQRTRAGGVLSWAELTSPSTITAFKALDFVKRKVLTEACPAARFAVRQAAAPNLPCVEFVLKITRGGGSTLVYGTTAMRGASTQPAY